VSVTADEPIEARHQGRFEFIDDIKGGVIPKEYIPSVEKGCAKP
jgi:elongation factor G